MIMGHMDDMALLPGQKTHITRSWVIIPFGALSSLAFDYTYDMK